MKNLFHLVLEVHIYAFRCFRVIGFVWLAALSRLIVQILFHYLILVSS